eukprot:CAMPEP_0198512438 /NCGR_PEP_ID=MMETSP1462-20131121/15445_1 /TAXON_ID=1333877 /ORGANISM="Brandtodinium nutriculum, Strain RCC3387" /LENGTH=564 /DNA_ID=CAMNT_0044241845 /DNA_START=15 /DNA_END=1705 /DNA_ORIENTATION=-
MATEPQDQDAATAEFYDIATARARPSAAAGIAAGPAEAEGRLRRNSWSDSLPDDSCDDAPLTARCNTAGGNPKALSPVAAASAAAAAASTSVDCVAQAPILAAAVEAPTKASATGAVAEAEDSCSVPRRPSRGSHGSGGSRVSSLVSAGRISAAAPGGEAAAAEGAAVQSGRSWPDVNLHARVLDLESREPERRNEIRALQQLLKGVQKRLDAVQVRVAEQVAELVEEKLAVAFADGAGASPRCRSADAAVARSAVASGPADSREGGLRALVAPGCAAAVSAEVDRRWARPGAGAGVQAAAGAWDGEAPAPTAASDDVVERFEARVAELEAATCTTSALLTKCELKVDAQQRHGEVLRAEIEDLGRRLEDATPAQGCLLELQSQLELLLSHFHGLTKDEQGASPAFGTRGEQVSAAMAAVPAGAPISAAKDGLAQSASSCSSGSSGTASSSDGADMSCVSSVVTASGGACPGARGAGPLPAPAGAGPVETASTIAPGPVPVFMAASTNQSPLPTQPRLRTHSPTSPPTPPAHLQAAQSPPWVAPPPQSPQPVPLQQQSPQEQQA